MSRQTAATRKARGKRSGPSDPHRGTQVKFYADPVDVEQWRALAARSGRTLSGWLRWIASQEVERCER